MRSSVCVHRRKLRTTQFQRRDLCDVYSHCGWRYAMRHAFGCSFHFLALRWRAMIIAERHPRAWDRAKCAHVHWFRDKEFGADFIRDDVQNAGESHSFLNHWYMSFLKPLYASKQINSCTTNNMCFCWQRYLITNPCCLSCWYLWVFETSAAPLQFFCRTMISRTPIGICDVRDRY